MNSGSEVSAAPVQTPFCVGQTLVIWRSLCYDIDGAKNEMESCGDVPQSRITPSRLSNLLMGVLGADRARDCVGESS